MHRQFKRTRTALLLAVALILLAGSDAGLAQRGARPTVETVQFHSTLVGKTLPYNVVLPGDYRASRVTRYPVLYLLHGLTGHYSDWLTRSNVADYASKYRIIIVMPEGNDGWYTDSASVASDKYESYFIRELLPDVQKRYRTIDSRYGRGVAGLSMGGYGALKFGLKYPATFAFAGSMSGALGAASWSEKEMAAFPSLRDSFMGVFGPLGSETRKTNDVFELVRDDDDRACGLASLFLSRLRNRRRAGQRQRTIRGAFAREEDRARVPATARQSQLAILGSAGAGSVEDCG